MILRAAILVGILAGIALSSSLGCTPLPLLDEIPGDAPPAEATPDARMGDPPSLTTTSAGASDLSFEGESGTFALSEYRVPEGSSARLLVVRESAAFCGTCAWHASHTSEITTADIGARIDVVDLLVSNTDNEAALVSDLPAWRARIDAPTRVGVDPDRRLGAFAPQARALPLYVIIDARRMATVATLSDPGPDDLLARLRLELAALEGRTTASQTLETRFDGRFNREQWEMIRAMKRPEVPPPDPSNAFADSTAAAALGKKLFEDARLSPSGTISCMTCHEQAQSFADGLAQSTGVSKVGRNAPSISLAAHSRWQFWDGRADSLWAQALGPPENASEVGSSRLFIAHAIHDLYKEEYESVFTTYPMPNLADGSRFPAAGKPGDAAYDAMSGEDRDAITRVYVNFGKALAAFERRLRVLPNALDRYIDGDLAALDDPQKAGLESFLRAGCAQCHHGPRLTDDAFHNAGFGGLPGGGAPERGREAVIGTSPPEFALGSSWSDDRSRVRGPRASRYALGAFKTPALRGVARTAPYTHAGTLPALSDVVTRYGRPLGGPPLPGEAPPVGTREPWISGFPPATAESIVRFLQTLTAEPVTP